MPHNLLSPSLLQYIESPDVEKEVKRLLSTDAEAAIVRILSDTRTAFPLCGRQTFIERTFFAVMSLRAMTESLISLLSDPDDKPILTHLTLFCLIYSDGSMNSG